MFKKSIAMLIAAMTFMTAAQLSFAETENIDEQTTISFLKDERNEKELGQLLTNGETYEFPIIITNDGENQELKDTQLDGYKIVLRANDGKDAITSISAEKDGSAYNLVVKPKAGWPTDKTEVSYNFIIASKATGKSVVEKEIDFTVGYATLSDDAYKNVEKGDFVTVTDKAPVITNDQFNVMDKLADGGKVTFTNSNWRYEVKVSDQDTLNLLNHKNANKTLMQAFPNQEFEFFNFPAGSEFDFTGTMTFDVVSLEDDFGGNFYVYRYYKGIMNKIDATFDQDEETITFNTKWLGNFVLTNKEIEDGTVVEDIKDIPSIDDNQTTDKPAPPTGALV